MIVACDVFRDDSNVPPAGVCKLVTRTLAASDVALFASHLQLDIWVWSCVRRMVFSGYKTRIVDDMESLMAVRPTRIVDSHHSFGFALVPSNCSMMCRRRLRKYIKQIPEKINPTIISSGVQRFGCADILRVVRNSDHCTRRHA
jgi:hypothetical protein